MAEIRADFEDDMVRLDNALHALELVAEVIGDDPHNTTPQRSAALEHVVAGVRAAADRLNRYARELPPRRVIFASTNATPNDRGPPGAALRCRR